MKRILIPCAWGAALSLSIPAQTTWHVAAEATPPGTGTLADPFPLIQDAIGAASGGDTVLVGPGTYLENLNLNGKAITVRSSAGAAATVVDCGGVFHVVSLFTGETAATTVQGFTLTNGSSIDGGGILCVQSSPRILDCVITGNVALNDGGGIHCFDASPLIEGCTVTGNSCGFQGGGISAVAGSQPTIRDCTVTGNSTAFGGGIASNLAAPAVVDCLIADNDAGSDGGGIQALGGSPTVSRTTIAGNAAGFGAGLNAVSGTDVTLTDCVLRGNEAQFSGGGVSAGSSTVTLVNCVVAGNEAGGFGGGVYHTDTTATLLGCTVRGNVSGLPGGGLYAFDLPGAAVTNSIVWANAPDQLAAGAGVGLAVTFSDVQGGFAGAGNLDADPLHADPAGFDFHLLAGSPCLDAGTNGAPGLPATDFEGNPRVLGAAVDLGVDERAAPLPGTGEDLVLATTVDGAGEVAVLPAAAGSAVAVHLNSPGGTFVGALPVIGANLHPTGTPPVPTPFFAGSQLDLGGLLLLVNGSAPPPFFVAALPPGGLGTGFTVPAGLAGMSLRLQGVAAGPAAANGFIAATAAHELVIQ